MIVFTRQVLRLGVNLPLRKIDCSLILTVFRTIYTFQQSNHMTAMFSHLFTGHLLKNGIFRISSAIGILGTTGTTLIAASFLAAPAVNAMSVTRIDESAFKADAGLITFSELPSGTVNPTYSPVDYGGGAGAPTVTFGGFFNGQNQDAPFPAGAARSGVVNGNPTASISLDSDSPDTFITDDRSNPTSPVLSGTPRFNGAISLLFDKNVAGVGLDGGFFDAIGGTAIKAFSRDGSVIGSVNNRSTGIEFLGLVTEDSSEAIAGLQFSLIGPEPAGFAIDNLRFGLTEQIDNPILPGGNEVPTPALLPGLIGMGVAAMRKRKGECADTTEA